MALVTAAEVRGKCGVGTDIIDDTTINSLIDDIQKLIISGYGIFLEPKKVIEILDGNNKNQIRLNKPFVWKVLKLENLDDLIDLSNITINPYSSIVTIDNTQNPYYFYGRKNSVKVKYLSAFMEKTITITETTAAIEIGTSVVISVDSETGFAVDDWVLIEGLDGKREAAKITATSTGSITVDELVQDHETTSVITLLQTHELLRQLVLYESAIAAGINATGGSYSFATGYTYPEYSVQKGVPYPHFSKNVEQNMKQSNKIKGQILAKLNPIY